MDIFFGFPPLAGSFQATYLWGILYPSAFSSLKPGAAVSPIDKLLKDSALPPVTSKKSILFFRVTEIVGFCKGL
jgi:hypothetical protein